MRVTYRTWGLMGNVERHEGDTKRLGAEGQGSMRVT